MDRLEAEAVVDVLAELRSSQEQTAAYRLVYLLTLELLADAQARLRAQDRTIARFHKERRASQQRA